ncbi:MAG: hypothetical protein ACR2FN_01025 [Chitinophagaceae bacterium]
MHEKILLAAFLLIIFVTVYEACRKPDLSPSNADQQLIESAKASFTNQITKGNIGSSNANLNARQLLTKTALWNEANTMQLSIGKAVLIPLSFNETLLCKGNFSDSLSKLALASISKLLMWKDAQQQFHAEVVTSFPDSNYKKSSNTFSGVVLVEDWFGNLLKKFSYHNDKISGGLNPSAFKSNHTNSSDLYETYTCYYEDWYEPVYLDDGSYYYEYSYTEDLGCFPDGGGYTGGGGTPTGGDYGMIQGGGYGAPPPPPPSPAADPCGQAAKLSRNTTFQSTINNLKTAANNLNYETGDTYNINSDGSMTFNQINGNPGEASISIHVTTLIDGFEHSHYTGLLSVFSPDDFQTMYSLYKGSAMTDPLSFTAGVVTASGTSYLLMINDPVKFNAFGQEYFSSTMGFKIFSLAYGASYNITETILLAKMKIPLCYYCKIKIQG